MALPEPTGACQEIFAPLEVTLETVGATTGPGVNEVISAALVVASEF